MCLKGEPMSDFDRREYQTVVLAALLHDIGKFMQRAEVEKLHPEIKQNYDEFCPTNEHGKPGYLHAAHTAYFIEHIIPDSWHLKTCINTITTTAWYSLRSISGMVPPYRQNADLPLLHPHPVTCAPVFTHSGDGIVG